MKKIEKERRKKIRREKMRRDKFITKGKEKGKKQ